MAWSDNPEVVHTIQHEYKYLQPGSSPCPQTNFLKGVRWSPDGACLLTASDDAWIRIYDLPQDCMTTPAALLQQPQPPSTATDQLTTSPGLAPWDPSQPDTMGVALRVQEGECVYDYAWYSRMSALEPQSCCFATTSRGLPIHLWDAATGELRATYRGYSDVDEVTAAYSLAFAPDGSQVYGGYSKWILAFDVTRPGRDSRRINCGTKGPRGTSARLPGMVSCMAFAPDGHALAAGTYGRVIGVFDPRIPELQLLLSGHKGGLTQLLFTHDGHYLLSGARQDRELLCWDLRGGSGGAAGEPYVVYRLERDTADTNQRIGFSLDAHGRHVATGGCNGSVRVFDLQTGELAHDWPVADDTVNGCDFHPCLDLLAVATGHRRYIAEDGPSCNEDQTGSPVVEAMSEESERSDAGQAGPADKTSCHPTLTNSLRILRLQQREASVSVPQTTE